MAGGAPVAVDTARAVGLHLGPAIVAATHHKKTAAKSAAGSPFFFGGSGLLALRMRAELAQPGLQLVSDHTYDELFTMHGSGMIYLFLTPAALGLGLYLVPLQHGAGSDPWAATIPLSGSTHTPGVGMDLWVIGAGLAVLGSLLIALTIVLTIVGLR